MRRFMLKHLSVLLPWAVMLPLSTHSQAYDYNFADVNRDGEISIADVNAVIDAILGKPVMPQQNKTFTVNGVSFTMVQVKGGTFVMGADDNDTEARPDERPKRMVQVSDYYIGKTEVTQELWDAVMNNNPSSFSGINKPVERVSWNECKEFISRLNALTGQRFRLPTEAEWEFAARGGNSSNGFKYAGSNDINDVAWWGFEIGGNNTSYTTQPVATLAPNELGIYDMSGNVFEWCNDWYAVYPGPTLHVDPRTIYLEDIPASGNLTTGTFTISGYHLSDDVYLTIDGDGFSVSPTHINVNDANNNNVQVTITYTGPRAEAARATITVSSKDANDATLNVYYYYPELDIDTDNPLWLQEEIVDGDTISKGAFRIFGNNLTGNVILSADDGFSVTPSVIEPIDGRIDGDDVTVTYWWQTSANPVSGTIRINCAGLHEQLLTVIAQKSVPDTTELNLTINRPSITSFNETYQGYVDIDPKGPSYGSYRVIRGGSWNVEARFCRSTYRYNNKPDFKHYSIGLRLAM